jgi:hypothetical protein
MFIIDAHLDLAMNAVEWDRDLRKSVPVLRQLEKGMTDKPDRANGTVSLPQLRQGNIGLVVATQIARVETRHRYKGMANCRTSLGAYTSSISMVPCNGS